METRFEISSDGIDPLEYVKDYFPHLTDKEISVLVGSIAFLGDVDLKVLQSVLNLEQIEVEEKIGRLMQTDLLDGHFTATDFILDKFNYKIKKQLPNLTLDDRIFIAYLKARFQISLTELQNTFDLSYPSTIFLLSGFVSKGLISPQKIAEDEYEIIVHFKYPKRNPEDVSNLEKQIVGFFELMGRSSIREVAEAIEEPQHKVLATLTNLILSEMVMAKFETSTKLFGGYELSIVIDKFQVYFPRLSIQVLSNNERNFIGYLSLRKEVKVEEIASIINLSRTETIKLAAIIQATNQLDFEYQREKFVLKELRPISVNRSLDILSKIHVFNYRVLVGLIQTQKKISIREISSKMAIPNNEAINALIAAYLEGFISGYLDSRGIFTLSAIQYNEKKSDITLEKWEKIILGALISEERITWPKIAALLEIDRFTARNRAFEFISKGISNTIAKDTVLSLEKIPNLPPLVQISELSRLEKQVLGYIQSCEELQIRQISNHFNLSNIKIFRLLYFLTGAGLVRIQRERSKFHVTNIVKIQPERSISELDLDSQIVVKSIELQTQNPIDLKAVAKETELRSKDVLLILYELLASGYYTGLIKGRMFTKTSSLMDIHDAGICLFCSKSLPSGANQCPHCHQPIPMCGVCRGFINSNDQLLACPKCKNPSHANHIKQWLQVKGQCPFCRDKISINQLLVQQPLL